MSNTNASGFGAGEPSSPPMSAEGSGGNALTLSPPTMSRGLSISPGAASDLSNEAVGGHSLGISGGNLSSFAHQMANAPSPGNGNKEQLSARVVRGGFDQDQSNLSTPVVGHSMDNNAETDIHPTYPSHDRGIGNNSIGGPSIASGSMTAIGDSSGNGYSNTSQSVGNFSQFTTTSSAGGPPDEVIPTTFDESTLRALCDMDVSNNS